MKAQPEATRVVRISLDEPLEALRVEDRYREIVLIVMSGGAVIGQLWLPRLSVFPAPMLARLIAAQIGARAWYRSLRDRVLLAGQGAEEEGPEPPRVAVIVCTRNRTDHLERCLESLAALVVPPAEVIVVDNAPSDDGTERLCTRFPVRYLLEPLPGQSRARNRGIVESEAELVAFTDDDCVVDPHWLDGLGRTFADPLVMAATGYTAPAELETVAQRLFEAHGGFPKQFGRVIFDGRSNSPANVAHSVGAGANMIFRRSLFNEVGLFAEDLGPGTPARAADDTYQMYKLLAAGYRVEYDSSRIVWHSHRRDEAALRRILFEYGRASIAHAVRLVVRHREPAALRLFSWWTVHSLLEIIKSVRDPDWLSFGAATGEARGMLTGPTALLRSKLSRRGISPVATSPKELRPPAPRLSIHAEAPPLSLVIPSRNRRAQLQTLLVALRNQTYPPDRFETIVALDGSEDDSNEMVRNLDLPYRIQLLEHAQSGAAATRNRGVEAAGSSHVAFLDDDIVPEPNFLAVHAEAHRRAKDEQFALGRCPPVVEAGDLWGQLLRIWWEDHYRAKATTGHRWTFTDLDGGNVSFPRQTFVDAGGFDTAFPGRGREDWELGTRLLDRGVRFAYYPDAVAWHHLDTRLETNLRHQRLHAWSDVILARKHPHLKSQLPLASFFSGLPDPSTRLTAYGPPLARLLAAARLRRKWGLLVDRMLVNAYVLGLLDAFGTAEAFGAFVGSVWERSVISLPIRLGHFGPAPLPRAGSLELFIESGRARSASIPATRPGGDWEWEKVADQLVDRVADSTLASYVLEKLEQGSGEAGHLQLREVARAR